MPANVDLNEFLSGFFGETEEILAAARATLLSLDHSLRHGEPNLRAIREMFRGMHTVKGLAAMVGINPIVDLAHALETLLREADRRPSILTAESIDALQKGIQAIEQRLGELNEGKPINAAPSQLLEAIEGARARDPAAAPFSTAMLDLPTALADKLTDAERQELARGIAAGQRALWVDFTSSAERAARGVTITTVRERLGAVADIVRVVPVSVSGDDDTPAGVCFTLLLLSDASDEAIAEAADTTADQLHHVATVAPPRDAIAMPDVDEPELAERRAAVRVDVARLDALMDRLSALTVTRFRLDNTVRRLSARDPAARELREILQENTRQLRELRAAIVRVRMVPVSELVERLPLLVRGLRRSTGKAVGLELDAGRTELDKSVAEKVFPALVHLIRNAVDHAIEDPDERRKLGKPAEGTVRLTCVERSSNQLEISVSDDGRGISVEAIAAAAGREAPQGNAALLELLTIPGLTTRREVTVTSGRGMGMDIVKRIVVDQLGGEILLDTMPDRGTTFTLRIPVTISIVDAFTCECAGQLFVVPVTLVEEVVEVEPGGLVRPPDPGAHAPALFDRRGETVPLLDLAALFELRREGASSKALVVRRRGEPVAFAVDRLLGQQEVVIRPLDNPLVSLVGLSGTTDLGDGRATLVLDLVALSGTLEPATEGAAS